MYNNTELCAREIIWEDARKDICILYGIVFLYFAENIHKKCFIILARVQENLCTKIDGFMYV